MMMCWPCDLMFVIVSIVNNKTKKIICNRRCCMYNCSNCLPSSKDVDSNDIFSTFSFTLIQCAFLLALCLSFLLLLPGITTIFFFPFLFILFMFQVKESLSKNKMLCYERLLVHKSPFITL